jgi:8-oxo-dGTP pyrophosphatase MutT (NUDIX family)
MKKRGFGEGLWNGVGGKQKGGEGLLETAKREAEEEIGVILNKLKKMAVINFFFPHNTDWSQQVVVYTCEVWEGKPKESEEMKPRWFKKDKLPFKKMWWDDPYWLPKVLEGKKIKASFLFNEKEEILDYFVEEVKKR